jgi:hypothetical protein
MKIKNVLLVCLVVIACSFLILNKNAISQTSVDGGDIVMMNIQNGEITLVYHKPSKTFLFYGYPSSSSRNKGLQLLQMRNLSTDFEMAEKLAQAKAELENNGQGYSVEEIERRADSIHLILEKGVQGGHYRGPVSPLKKEK